MNDTEENYKRQIREPGQYYPFPSKRDRGNWLGKLEVSKIGETMSQDYLKQDANVTFQAVFDTIDSLLCTPSLKGLRILDAKLNERDYWISAGIVIEIGRGIPIGIGFAIPDACG